MLGINRCTFGHKYHEVQELSLIKPSKAIADFRDMPKDLTCAYITKEITMKCKRCGKILENKNE